MPLLALVHPGLEEAGPIAAVGFRPIESDIGVLQDSGRLIAVGRYHRHADAGAHHGLGSVETERLRHDGKNAFAQGMDVLELGDIHLQYRELVTPETGDEVRIADAAAKTLGAAYQDLIAGGVPEAVIDRFEAVEIEAQHGGLLMVRAAA